MSTTLKGMAEAAMQNYRDLVLSTAGGQEIDPQAAIDTANAVGKSVLELLDDVEAVSALKDAGDELDAQGYPAKMLEWKTTKLRLQKESEEAEQAAIAAQEAYQAASAACTHATNVAADLHRNFEQGTRELKDLLRANCSADDPTATLTWRDFTFNFDD